jgi:hypothetical protein
MVNAKFEIIKCLLLKECEYAILQQYVKKYIGSLPNIRG